MKKPSIKAPPENAIAIEPARQADFAAIWPIYRSVLARGDSYSYSPKTTKEEAKRYWFGKGSRCFVAKIGGRVAGCFLLRPNRDGLASHVANAAFIVSEDFRRRGVARTMGEYALQEARRQGFEAMQFNFVVSTNEPAVVLWKSLGFKIVGTLPKGYRHLTKGYVDVYIMHRPL
jgi:L-amino acid N-acyltransferase YncA